MSRFSLLQTASTAALLAAFVPAGAYAQVTLPTIQVEAQSGDPLGTSSLSSGDVLGRRLSSPDTAGLLSGLPGVNLMQAGAISGLPTVNGFADDRIRISVDGMDLTSSCGNHMNPPTSYIDPANVGGIDVMAGITPVRLGGDSLGGTIVIDPAPPPFAEAGQGMLVTGSASAMYRSVSSGLTLSGTATMATEDVSLSYTGAWNHNNNYQRGGDNAGVMSTESESHTHALALAIRRNGDVLTLRGGLQFNPYQGFPNQRMDLIDNQGQFLNARYQGSYDWGTLDARVYWQHVAHEMNFLSDKGGHATGGMPMNTRGTDLGYSVAADIPLNERHTLRVGNELHYYMLDDWWPPVAGKPMMSPDTYWNINDGRRVRLGTYAEWQARWDGQWSTLLGVRNDTVWMDTGAVQPYSWANPIRSGMMTMANPDAAAAAAFNARDRAQTDVNFDITATARYTPDAVQTYEFGYARKTRSPNLYERYAWGVGNMAAGMTSWFGDANGYIGNIDLSPEVAHTLSVTANWHDEAREVWEVSATPYVSYVQDYIDADRVGPLGADFVKLRFANHDALLYGVNLNGAVRLYNSDAYGAVRLLGSLGITRGENLDRHGNLYRMMPLNGRVALQHSLGGWSGMVELNAVASKSVVDANRNELQTPGYALLNLRASYAWRNLRLDFAIENVLDQRYYSPLGGVDFTDYRVNRNGVNPLAGPGRSFNLGLTVSF